MKVGQRLAPALVLAFALTAATPPASASAAPPLTIESPANGSFTLDRQPVVRGIAVEERLFVTISLESEGKDVGAPFKAEQTGGGHWEAVPPEPLKPGTYTAVASQANALFSAPVTFTVVTPPHVTLNPIPSPSSNVTPSFSGSAGTDPWDEPQVTVRVYAGAAASGSLAEVINVSTGGRETWSTPPAPALPEGEYTAIAEQKYHAEHPAASESESVSFVLAPGSYVLATGQVPPTASLTWIPATPYVNEPVSLVSTSLGGSSPIVSYSWDPAGSGKFVAGGAVFTTMFTTAGPHVVRLLVTDARGNTGIARSTILVALAHRRLMQPFPVVRIAGTVTARGAKIRLLSVAAPPGALVTVHCHGRSCGTKVQSRLVAVTAASERTGMSLLAFPRFERPFRAGTVLRIVIRRGNEVGKYTSFVIRRGGLPVRNDACLEPLLAPPVACPST
jgi:hypothetical protein